MEKSIDYAAASISINAPLNGTTKSCKLMCNNGLQLVAPSDVESQLQFEFKS